MVPKERTPRPGRAPPPFDRHGRGGSVPTDVASGRPPPLTGVIRSATPDRSSVPMRIRQSTVVSRSPEAAAYAAAVQRSYVGLPDSPELGFDAPARRESRLREASTFSFAEALHLTSAIDPSTLTKAPEREESPDLQERKLAPATYVLPSGAAPSAQARAEGRRRTSSLVLEAPFTSAVSRLALERAGVAFASGTNAAVVRGPACREPSSRWSSNESR